MLDLGKLNDVWWPTGYARLCRTVWENTNVSALKLNRERTKITRVQVCKVLRANYSARNVK